MALEQLVVELELDDTNFTGRLKVNSAALRAFQKTVNGANTGIRNARGGFQGFGATLRDTLVTLGAFRYGIETLTQVMQGTFGALIRANAQLEKMQVLMKGLSKETSSMAAVNKEAEDSMQYLLDMSQASPTNLSALTDSFVKMKAAGIDPTNGSMQGLVDSVAKFGGSDEQLKRASIALQQMAGKGVISMEELRQQLGEAIPNAVMAMARAVGLPMGELVKQISLGKVEATRAMNSMLSQMQFENAGAAANMAKTWDGLMNRLKTQWLLFAKDVGDAGYFEEAKSALRDLLDGFLSSNEATSLARDLGQALTELIRIVRSGVTFIYEYRDALLTVLQAFIAIKAVNLVGNVLGGISSNLLVLGGQMRKGAANTRLLATSMARMPLTVRGASTAMGSLAASVSGAVRAKGAGTAAANAMAVAMRGMGVAASFALGPLGVLAGIVAALGYRYVQTRKRAEELREELNKGVRSDLNEQEMAAARAQVAEMEEKLSDLQEMARTQSEERRQGGDAMWSEESIQDNIDAYKKEMNGYEAAIKAINESITATISQSAAAAARRSAEAALDEVSQGTALLRLEYVNELEALKQELIDRGATVAEYNEEFLAARSQKRNAILELEAEQVRQLINDVAITMARATENGLISPEATAAARAEILVYQNRLASLAEQMQEMGGFDTTTGLNDEDGKLTQAEQWFNRITERMEEMKAKANETNPYLAELAVRIKAWKDAGEEVDENSLKLLAAQMYEAEQAIAAVKSARTELDDMATEMDSLEQRLLKRGDKADTDFGAYQAVIAEFNDVNRTVLEAESRAQALHEELQQVGEQYGSTTQAVARYNEMMRQANNVDGLNTDNLNAEIQKRLTQDRLEIEREIIDAKGESIEVDQEAISALNNLLQLDSISVQTKRMIQETIEIMEAAGQKVGWMTAGWLRFSDEFGDITDEMSDVWYDALNGMGDMMTDMLLDGEADFQDFARSMTKMITQLLIKMAMVRAFDAAMSMGAGASTTTTPQSGTAVIKEFATGGIMSSYGPLELKKYANGGIARSPQLALYGEGRMPEAYVPLPDGRSIPVTVDMEGMHGGGGAVVAPIIGFNLFNQSGERLTAEQQGEPRIDGEGFVVDVVLRNMSRPGPLRDAIKGSR